MIKQIPFTEYLKAEGVSKSMLDKLHPTPAHFKQWLDNKDKEQETAALTFGRCFHSAALENRQDYYVKPEGMKFSTKDGIAWRESHSNKPILDSYEGENIEGMLKALRSHKWAGQILKISKAEQSIFTTDKETGLKLKCRPDLLPAVSYFAGGCAPIVDLKTCESAEPKEFAKEIEKYRYHVQGYAYLSCYNAVSVEQRKKFILIAIEKKPPFAIGIYELNDLSIIQGRIEYRRDLKTYAECVEKNEWPSYPTQPQLLQIPTWAVEREALDEFANEPQSKAA